MSLQKSCLRPSRLQIYKVLVDLRVLLIRSGAFKSQEDSITNWQQCPDSSDPEPFVREHLGTRGPKTTSLKTSVKVPSHAVVPFEMTWRSQKDLTK